MTEKLADALRVFALAGSVSLATAAVIILPGRVQAAPVPAPEVTQVSTVPGASTPEPFAGYDPTLSSWATEYGWGPVDTVVKSWTLPEPTPTR